MKDNHRWVSLCWRSGPIAVAFKDLMVLKEGEEGWFASAVGKGRVILFYISVDQTVVFDCGSSLVWCRCSAC